MKDKTKPNPPGSESEGSAPASSVAGTGGRYHAFHHGRPKTRARKGASANDNPDTPIQDESLGSSELRYRRLFESARDGILILDAETGIVMDVNPFLTNLLGYAREEVVGMAVWQLGFFKDAIASFDKFLELQQHEYVRYEDLPLETVDGERRDVEFVSNVYMAGDKKVIQCNIRDISVRKLAETYRKMQQDILQILNEPGDPEGYLRRVLAVLKTQTGFDAVGIRLQQGDDFPYFVQEGFDDAFLKQENSLLARDIDNGICRDKRGNINLECTCGRVISGTLDPASPFSTPGGSFWTNDALHLLEIPPGEDPRHKPRNQCIHHGYASVAMVPIRNQHRIVGLIQFNDWLKDRFTLESVELLEGIAAHIGSALVRKKAEAEIQSGKAFLDCIINAMASPVFIKDAQRRFVLVNDAFCALVGHPKEKIMGKTDEGFFPPEQAEVFQKTDDAVYATGKASMNEESLTNATSGEVYGIITRKTCYTDQDKNKFIVGVMDDITDLKRAESEKIKLADQLRQAQKMESVGRLAGGVAHDFNNQLTGILGYAELCRGELESGHPITKWLDEITISARRSSDITRQLLAYARKQTIKPKILNLNQSMGTMLKLLQHLIGEDIHLEWRPAKDLGSARLDPTQLDQILTNLCVNARDAIAGNGQITIETKNSVVDEAYCSVHAEAVPGSYVVLAVSDDGCGMDKTTLANIFEPFFTTKDVGKGTGLGLATVYGIVKQNNGFINAYSEPGAGSTFRIFLPRVAAEAAETDDARPPDAPESRGETVLLVEDEKSLRAVCSHYLGSMGYGVITAESPEQALEIAGNKETPFQLLLTDVVMPGMDGRQLAQQICAIQPDVKVLLMSGYPADIIAQRGLLDKNTAFIEKPFERYELAVKLRSVLNGGPASRNPPGRETDA